MTALVLIGKGQVPRNASPGEAAAPAVPRGHVQIYCSDPPRNLVVPLGDSPVKLAGGSGGWESVGRPHQTAMTVWSGGDPYQVALPLMLDGFAGRVSVERTMRVLNRLARGDDDSEPGVVELGGVPLPADEWVIDSLDWGDPIRDVTTMAVVRQPVTVTLLEYVPPEYVQLRRRSLAKPKRKTRVVKVKRGDTPVKIARRVKAKWPALRELNPKIVKRANQRPSKGTPFHVGARIRVPIARKPAKRGGHSGRRGRGNDND